MKIRVYYEDTDAGGIVYYANYFKFTERGRTELLIDLGVSQSKILKKHDIKFIVHSVSMEYINDTGCVGADLAGKNFLEELREAGIPEKDI